MRKMTFSRIVKLLPVIVLPVLFFRPSTEALAQGDEMAFTSYYFSDSGLNKVITTSFNIAKKLLERTSVLIDIELDHVTVPPVTAVTGATRPQRRKNEPFEKSGASCTRGP